MIYRTDEHNITPCVHAWVVGLADKAQAGFGVSFPLGEYANVSQLVSGAQTNNQAEASAMRTAVQTVK